MTMAAEELMATFDAQLATTRDEGKAWRATLLEFYEGVKDRGPRDAWRACRTEVHAVLHLKAPSPEVTKGEDPDDHWHRQKSHGKALWRTADAIVTAAGITEGGIS
jgi:hypothetical protein